MDHFLNSLLNLLCFLFWLFGHEACGILAPSPGFEPALLAMEGEVLITEPPGKSVIKKKKILMKYMDNLYFIQVLMLKKEC